MFLLELAAQGVRGVAPQGGRANLRPGYNVVSVDGATLRRVIEALLYPSATDADLIPRASAQQGHFRAGLTLAGGDRVTYRVVRDFASGCQLHRFDPAKRSFSLVALDLPSIATYLEKVVGVPRQGRLRAFLSLAASEMPSRRNGMGALPLAQGRETRAASPDEARKRVERLTTELEKAKAAQAVQSELEGLQTKLFKFEDVEKGATKIREGLASALAAREALGETAKVAAALGDADEKLALYEQLLARREEALKRAEKEHKTLDLAEAAGPPRPFFREGWFVACLGAGLLVGVLAAIAAAHSSELRYLSLLSVATYGVGAFLAMRRVGDVEAYDRIARRRHVIDTWAKKATDEFEKGCADVQGALSTLSLAGPKELKEQLKRLEEAEETAGGWQRRVDEWEASTEAKEASAEREALEEKVRELEAVLSFDGGVVRDTASIEEELKHVEADLASPVSPPPLPPQPPSATVLGRPLDPFQVMLELAAKELGISPSAAALGAAAKASQHVLALSFQKLSSVQSDDRGRLTVQAAGKTLPVDSLPPSERDLVWLSLKLAFMDMALGEGNAVALADDVFAGLSDGVRRVAARLLKSLARPGQIIHATTDPQSRETADHLA